MFQVLLFLFISGTVQTACGTKNILAITTLASPSHHIFHDVYLLELANRGYNITILGHDEDTHHHPNYTHITMEGVYDALSSDTDLIGAVEFSQWQSILELCWGWIEATSLQDTQTEGLKKLTNYPDDFKFDLIIWDINNAPALYPLVEKFGRPPVIGVNPFVNSPNVFRNVFQSHVPFFLYDYTDHMSHWQRIKSNFWTIVMELTRDWYFIPGQKRLARAYFGNKTDFLSMEDFERNITLLLTNHHPVLNYVEAFPPNVVPIGGLHVKRTQKLPNDLKRVMDGAKSGTILFSLGSNIKPRDLGDEKIRTILEAFSKLEQTVIWKFDHLMDINLPKNVRIQKWVPQSAILAHPNTVLFITHGGLLSSHEIFHHGIPVVGIPFYLDQIQNVGIFVAKGIGEKLAFGDIKGDNFYKVITKVLNDPRYRITAKKLSALYRNRQNEPLETAIYWIEYVLRHGTAGHLDLATRDMSLLQLYNLDLIFTALAPIFVCIILVAISCKRFNKPKTKLKAS